jgi:hypothetical protein
MMTTTYAWTKHLAALLLSCCLAFGMFMPSAAMARSRTTIDTPDRTGGQASRPSSRFLLFSWWPWARWTHTPGGW